jgi:hypothetical protein
VKALNEPIARQANKEDNCTGHFWDRYIAPRLWLPASLYLLRPVVVQYLHFLHHVGQARFKSQALLAEEAVLTCMAYVDLNPIRTCMAKTPETSDYSSIKERIQPQFDLENAIKEKFDLQSLNNFQLSLKAIARF